MTIDLLAHAAGGGTWQSLATVFSGGVAVVFLLAAIGKLRITTWADLTLPLAAVAVVSGLAPITGDAVADAAAWVVPVGVACLVPLIIAAATGTPVGESPLVAGGAVVVAVGGALLVGPILLDAWTEQDPTLPPSDDAALTITSPVGDTVEAGEVTVAVEVAGGSFGPPNLDPGDAPDDPEELGMLMVYFDGELLEVEVEQTCSVDAPCRGVTFPLEVEPGVHDLTVELRRWDGTPLGPPPYAVKTFEAEG
jgi:hypothetical protein